MDNLIKQCIEIAAPHSRQRKFHIVVLYENVVSAARALRACEFLRAELNDDVVLKMHVWKMSVLDVEENRALAASTSAVADVVIVSANGRDSVAPSFRHWVDSWLWVKKNRRCSVLAIFGDCPPSGALSIAAFLREKSPFNIDLFFHPEFDPTDLAKASPLFPMLGNALCQAESIIEDWRPGELQANRLSEDLCAFDLIEDFGVEMRFRLNSSLSLNGSREGKELVI
jgi:hypothetical protein